jgi:plastocyanin
MSLARSIALCAAVGLTASATPATTTITIVATNGAQSFTPNPASAATGDSVVWRNNDVTTHRIVLDNGSLHTGNISPGASSAPMTLTGAGGGYHCAIHPSMARGGAAPYAFAVTACRVPAGLTLSAPRTPTAVFRSSPTR